jgi:AcrR family transcriptional regulator
MSLNMEYGPEKKGVGRPRDGDPEETRKEILRAAEGAFAAEGFAGATTRKIAADARVNVATLHYHFGGKKGLYRAVLTEVAAGELPQVPESGTTEERLRRLVGALFDFTAKRPSLSRLALLDELAGAPREPGEAAGDRRVERLTGALRLFRTLPGADFPPSSLSPEEAGRLVVRSIDLALIEPPWSDLPPADPRRLRDAIVEASLRFAGAA